MQNLIDKSIYNWRPYKPPIRDPGDVRVIGGNAEVFKFKSFAVQPVFNNSTFIWYKFGVVPNLPLVMLVGADVLASHFCSFLYLKNKWKRLQFEIYVCSCCY